MAQAVSRQPLTSEARVRGNKELGKEKGTWLQKHLAYFNKWNCLQNLYTQY
jgi:hypothetical protein